MAASSLAKFRFALPQPKFTCHECKENIFKTGDICKDRAEHYVRYTYGVHSCPVCLLILPTTCAVAAHLRIHLKIPPYICPQCGMTLSDIIISYPFNHNCEGFNMMRASIKFKCNLDNCNNLVHPTQFKDHFQTHLAKVYQCTLCSLIWSNETKTRCQHYNDDKIIQSIGFQCLLCSNNLIADNNMANHVNKHYDELCHHWNIEIYPCKICHIIHKDVKSLLNHHVLQHNAVNIKNILENLSVTRQFRHYNTGHFRLIKTCNYCLMSYTCQFENDTMNILQNDCPNGCLEYNASLIKCPLCKMKINKSWINVKKHFAQYHEEHKCLDLQVKLTRLDKTQNDSVKAHTKVNESMQTAQIKSRNKIAKTETVVRDDDSDVASVERKVFIQEINEPVQKSGMYNDPLTKENKPVQIAESLTHCKNNENETQENNEDDVLMEEQASVPVNENNELVQAAEYQDVFKKPEMLKRTKEDLNKAGCSGQNKNNEPKQAAKKQYICIICKHICDTKENLETHLITHRDPSLPFQCLECGECYAARTSFSIHLLIGHAIREVQEYINTKPCYNEAARYVSSNSVLPTAPKAVKENQCEVCDEQLENALELRRHVRIHGLAFVLSLKRKRQLINPDVT